ncbi:MAG: DMT family transporter [Pseudomonadota bacterium]
MELWIVFSLTAALAQTLRFAVQKSLAAGTLSPAAATWARFLWSWPLALGLATLYGQLIGASFPNFSMRFVAYGLAGGLFQILATICTVSLFRQRAFAVGITFKKTEVMLTALVGYVLLGDVIPALGAAAIALGFVGVLLLSEPPRGGSLFNRAAAIGLLSGVLFALSAVTYRGAALALDTGDPVLTGGITLAVVAAWQTLVLWLWLWAREPGQISTTLKAWRPTLVVSLFSLVGSWSWFAAFSLMNAAYVFAVGQVELIFSLIIGWLWFGERLTSRELLGIGTLTLSILAISFLF